MKRLFLITTTVVLFSVFGFAKINPDFSPNQQVSLCGPTDVFFVCSAPDNPDNIWWDFGDGTLGTGLNPTHRYTTTGVYSVKMIVEKGGVKDSITKANFIILKPKPVAAFKNEILEVPQPFQRKFKFTGMANADSIVHYNWMVNGVAVQAGASLLYTFPENGTYPISLAVTNNVGCSDDVVDSVTINDDEWPTGIATVSGADKFSVSVSVNQPAIRVVRNVSVNETATIQVIDITGRIIHKEQLRSGETSVDINTAAFWPGAYIVELSSRSFSAAKRFDKIMM